jgi:hypothetical protein
MFNVFNKHKKLFKFRRSLAKRNQHLEPVLDALGFEHVLWDNYPFFKPNDALFDKLQSIGFEKVTDVELHTATFVPVGLKAAQLWYNKTHNFWFFISMNEVQYLALFRTVAFLNDLKSDVYDIDELFLKLYHYTLILTSLEFDNEKVYTDPAKFAAVQLDQRGRIAG